MGAADDDESMVTYQFECNDETWKAWKDTVPRSKSLDTRLRELIQADTDGRVADVDHEPEKTPVPAPESEPELLHAPEEEPDSESRDVEASPSVESVVSRISESWGDGGERLEQRQAAARAVLEYAVGSGEPVGRSDATERFFDDYQVSGQDRETWWRKNIRPVLKEVGEYDRGLHGYRVTELE